MQATMPISGSTRLADLLAHYPFLRQHLPSINPRFAMLNSPLAASLLRKATISEMSRRSGMAQDHLICSLEGLILHQK